MNTQAHAILNTALLGRKNRSGLSLPVVVGAILPDVPLFLFFGYESWILKISSHEIWREAYFEPGPWRNAIDLAHSFPLAILGMLISRFARSKFWFTLFSSALIHSVCDFLVHAEDAHRHFLPLSDWQFQSPVSYWDPAHFGHYFFALEIVLMLVCSFLIWKRGASALGKLSLALAMSFYALPLYYYLFVVRK